MQTRLEMTGDGCIKQTILSDTDPADEGGIDAGFSAATEFEGSRPGFVFKDGPQVICLAQPAVPTFNFPLSRWSALILSCFMIQRCCI